MVNHNTRNEFSPWLENGTNSSSHIVHDAFVFSNLTAVKLLTILARASLELCIRAPFSIWTMVIVTILFIYYQRRWQNGKRSFSTTTAIATLKFFSCCFLSIARERQRRQRAILLSTRVASTHTRIYIHMRWRRGDSRARREWKKDNSKRHTPGTRTSDE